MERARFSDPCKSYIWLLIPSKTSSTLLSCLPAVALAEAGAESKGRIYSQTVAERKFGTVSTAETVTSTSFGKSASLCSISPNRRWIKLFTFSMRLVFISKLLPELVDDQLKIVRIISFVYLFKLVRVFSRFIISVCKIV